MALYIRATRPKPARLTSWVLHTREKTSRVLAHQLTGHPAKINAAGGGKFKIFHDRALPHPLTPYAPVLLSSPHLRKGANNQRSAPNSRLRSLPSTSRPHHPHSWTCL